MLLIDEADTFIGGRDELRGMQSSGHKRGSAHVVLRVGENHEPQTFSTWAPKSIAKFRALEPTLADRSIEIRLRSRLMAQVYRERQ